ncbi:MAG TPA: bifunctional 5,10-methylenetetrahydrofolate dehydrogenase/5,10-methenyltetrahydrofolate cyclohydrolase [Candidatus Saccharimonadales bacterium]|nr:bifunctional 5,10-methylenetetrahydrofolate dehydrogenase/5,10-methenyltetrahydrofolate cyclohydrolase [Candidatus Saccharimonadales bacterium]
MRSLNGAELADFIKVRQLKQVRNLRQEHKIVPKLAIVQTVDSSVIDSYAGLKRRYGADILVDVDVHKINQAESMALVDQLNQDEAVHGIIIQLPLADPTQTDELVNLVAPAKDVDGLGEAADFDPATPIAINWLLTGYNVDLNNKSIAIVGAGRLVGAPLERMWRQSGLEPLVVDEHTDEHQKQAILTKADIIISAAGVPGLITSELIRPGAVVVDAGTATSGGKLVGDVDPAVRQRHDLTITPEKGGVGPLTVAALFDNLIRAARKTITS